MFRAHEFVGDILSNGVSKEKIARITGLRMETIDALESGYTPFLTDEQQLMIIRLYATVVHEKYKEEKLGKERTKVEIAKERREMADQNFAMQLATAAWNNALAQVDQVGSEKTNEERFFEAGQLMARQFVMREMERPL